MMTMTAGNRQATSRHTYRGKDGGSLALLSTEEIFSSTAAGGEHDWLSLLEISWDDGESDAVDGDLSSIFLNFTDECNNSFSLKMKVSRGKVIA